MAFSMDDLYEVLGIRKDADQTHIKTAYRKLILKYHPDKVTDEALKPAAVQNFHQIQEAYEILGNEDKKVKYDSTVARLAELKKREAELKQNNNNSETQTRSVFDYQVPTSRTASFASRGGDRYDYTIEVDGEEYFGISVPVPTSKGTSGKKQTSAERQSSKYSIKIDTSRRAYVKESVRSSRTDKRKVSERERRRDRETKVQLADDSESEQEQSSSKRYDSPMDFRDTFDARKQTSTDEDSSPLDSPEYSPKIRSSSEFVDNRPSRPRRGEESTSRRSYSSRTPNVDSLGMEFEQRSRGQSVRDIPRERVGDIPRERVGDTPRERVGERTGERDGEYRRDSYERSRKYSEPEIIFNTDSFSRPSLEKQSSIPTEKSSRRSKATSSSKNSSYDMPVYVRSATMPLPVRRPEGPSRGESKIREKTEFKYGLPTPGASPPYETSYTSARMQYYVIDDDKLREVSPLGTSRRPSRTASPTSPIEVEYRKSSSDSSRTSPVIASVEPVAYTRSTSDAAPYLTQTVEPVPRRSRQPAVVLQPIWTERLSESPNRKYSTVERERERERYDDEGIENVYPLESGRTSRKSSTKPKIQRGYTYTAPGYINKDINTSTMNEQYNSRERRSTRKYKETLS